MRGIDADPADLEDQRQPVVDLDAANDEPEIPLEAPEADVLEQSQTVPLDAEEEPR